MRRSTIGEMELNMKKILAETLGEIIYPFDEFNRLKDYFALPGENAETIRCAYGREIKKWSESARKCGLSDDVLYIARFMKDISFNTPDWNDRLVFFHVSMRNNTLRDKARERERFNNEVGIEY